MDLRLEIITVEARRSLHSIFGGGTSEEAGAGLRLWSLQGRRCTFSTLRIPERGGGSVGYRLFRRPQVSFLFAIVFVCLWVSVLSVFGLVGLWVCVFVCLCVCVFVFFCVPLVCA